MDKNGAKILTGFGVEMNDILLIDVRNALFQSLMELSVG